MTVGKSMLRVDGIFTFEDIPKHRFATAGHPYSLDPGHADVADQLLFTDQIIAKLVKPKCGMSDNKRLNTIKRNGLSGP